MLLMPNAKYMYKIQMAYATYAKIQNTNDLFKKKVRKYK